MKNPKGSKLKKIIFKMFDDMIEGADKYVTKSSTWLIFTEEKRWVIEFTNTKTLWFNYNLFQSELNLLSMDCVDSKDIIKEWFESRFLEKDIDHVTDTSNVPYSIVENTIQNGVKDAQSVDASYFINVENTIKNGVKNSQSFGGESLKLVEDTIQNGVKETIVGDGNVTCYSFDMDDNIIAEDVIQNGVKDILGWNFNMRQDNVEDTIENGVKEIDGDSSPLEDIVEDTIQNGVKYVKDVLESLNPDFEDTLKNGVKEVKSVYLRSCLGVGDAIQNGVKDTQTRMWPPLGTVDETIQNGANGTTVGTEIYAKLYSIEDTIQNGVKDTQEYYLDCKSSVEDVIQNGVKETIGTLRRTLLGVDDIIQNGVKDIGARHLRINRKVDDVIQNGVKNILTGDDLTNGWDARNIVKSFKKNNFLIQKIPYIEFLKENINKNFKIVNVNDVIEDTYHHKDRIEVIVNNELKNNTI